ncbi:abortive infection system antitoxin AbiGi family protein [Vibrio splendidus]
MSGLTQRYISKELLHFVGRGMEADAQFELFANILSEGWITHPPHNPNVSGNLKINTGASISNNEMYSPEITCFADIPLEDLSLHMDKYSSIGLSFSKDFIAAQGGVPVHYLPTEATVKKLVDLSADRIQEILSSQGSDALTEHMYESVSKSQHFDEMLKEYHELFAIFRELAQKSDPSPGVSGLYKRVTELERFLAFHLFSYFKFFDHRKADDDPDNYYFEREWRIVGNLKFEIDDVKTVLIPSQYSRMFRDRFPQYVGQIVFTD